MPRIEILRREKPYTMWCVFDGGGDERKRERNDVIELLFELYFRENLQNSPQIEIMSVDVPKYILKSN